MIKFHCENSGKKISVPEKHAGHHRPQYQYCNQLYTHRSIALASSLNVKDTRYC